jgi:hypothetical protein
MDETMKYTSFNHVHRDHGQAQIFSRQKRTLNAGAHRRMVPEQNTKVPSGVAETENKKETLPVSIHPNKNLG